MGTQEGERDWVDVANNLLSKCHVNLRLRKLTDCSADVFITLYENILGEKVPDYIGEPCSQEDDVHNVQSVIDSLSLDYLQISLSHITGENVVRGHRESIKNLLEIFDGLLEYLSEEFQDAVELKRSVSQDVLPETKDPATCDPPEQKEKKQDGASGSSSAQSAVLSSRHSLWCCHAKDRRASGEDFFSVGAPARTFPDKPEAASSDTEETEGASQLEPSHSAVALQPPDQRDGASVHPPHAPGPEKTSNPATVTTNGLHCAAGCLSPTVSDTSSAIQRRATAEVEGESLEPTNGGPRRVLFRTQPDVLFLTLQDEMAPTARPPAHTADQPEGREGPTLKERTPTDGKDDGRAEEAPAEPLCYRRQRNRQAEEELHHISENLSHRLEELDQMLKRVLGESYKSIEVKDEDKRSHHSDSIMECGRRRRSGSPAPASIQRTRSLSPSSPLARPGQREDRRATTPSPARRRQTNLRPPSRSRREEQVRVSTPRKHAKGVKIRGPEEELRRFEVKKRTPIDVARLQAQQAEREYREAILGDVSQVPRRPPAKTKTPCRPQRRAEATRRAPSLKIRENQLLPLLREELPHLHVSPRVLGRMWEQQMQQVDRLHAVPSAHIRRRTLCSQFEEAQNKHHLLSELVRKDKEHSRRLRDFRERIQQQKSTQNKLTEQRQQVALAKKYHSEYHVQHRARLMRARTKEERMFRQLFEEGLELQKVQLREQRAVAREQRAAHQRRREDQITSMENYYRDQFSLIAEKLAQEREEIQVRKKAQEKALLKMKRELRSRMEREIGELQRIIVQNDEDDHFQELEVQRLRNRVQTASFQYNTSYLH